MSHYFIKDPTLKNQEYNVKFKIKDFEFNLKSNNGVFSKKVLDEGSEILINYLLDYPLNGEILDLGCGYGPVGIVLKYFNNNVNVSMVDINEECIELTKINLNKYNLNNITYLSDGFNSITNNFDLIAFNPPIRIGKELIYKIYRDSFEHLNQNGEMFIVIRKDKGALSHKKYLETIFNQVDVVYKDKGYFIIKMKKI